MGARLTSRADKKSVEYVETTFTEEVWPQLLWLFEAASNRGNKTLEVNWRELGVRREPRYITEFSRRIEEKLVDQGITLETDNGYLEFVFGR